MTKNLHRKIGFVVLLFLTGLAAEFYFYSRVETNTSGAKKNVLIVGGSVTRGVKGELQSLLNEKYPETFEISEFITVGNNMGDILEAYPKLLTTHKPQVVFLLSGLDPYNFSNISTHSREYKELVEFSKLPDDALTKEILKRLKSRFENEDCYGLLKLKLSSEILHRWSYKINEPMIISEVEALAQTPLFMKNESCSLNILSYANYLSAKKGTGLGIEKLGKIQPYQGNPAELAIFINNINTLLKEGPEELRTMGLQNYLKSGTHLRVLDRAWLALQVKRNVPLNLAHQNYISFSPYYLLIRGLSMVRQEPPKGTDAAEILRIVDETISRPTDIQNETQIPADFRKSIVEIKKLTEKAHAKLFFLQPPNCTKNFITWMGRELSVPVVDGKSPFRDILKRPNYFTYFLDRVDGTGHMTPLGARIYAKGIFDQTFARSLNP